MADAPTRLPLPAGNLVAANDPRYGGLTLAERKQIQELTRKPANEKRSLKEIVDEVIAASRIGPTETPVAPDAAPVTLDEKTVRNVDQLSEEEVRAFDAHVADMARLNADLGRPNPLKGVSPVALAVPGVMAAVSVEPEPEPSPEAAAEESSTGLGSVAKVCPRCGFDCAQLTLIKPTKVDKLTWIASLYGPAFTKDFSILGGAVVVTFDQPPTAAIDAVYLQATADSRIDSSVFTSRVVEYQLCLSLRTIRFHGGKAVAPSRSKFTAADGSIDLPGLRDQVMREVLTSESLGKVVKRKFVEFEELIRHMELSSDDPNFLEEIGGTP